MIPLWLSYTVERVSFAAEKWNPVIWVFLPKSRVSRTGTSVKLVLFIVVPMRSSVTAPNVNLVEL